MSSTMWVNKLIHRRLFELYKECQPFKVFINCMHSGKEWREVTHYTNTHFEGAAEHISSYHGASRGVFVFDDLDWVVKFNFADEVNYRYDFNETEIHLYNEAVKSGFGDCFAKIWKGGQLFGVKFYIMEKAETETDAINDLFYSGYASSCEFNSCDLEISEFDFTGIVNFFSDTMSINRLRELLDFCVDNAINDIHDENVGLVNGKPVFIDYAGYV